MTTDRELLELAAKAAGYQICVWGTKGSENFARMDIPSTPRWNPLTDDGDALRLAAKLRLQIKPGKHVGDGCTVESQRDGVAGCTAFYDDKEQQMRYAIVQVAAEIGRGMP